MRVSDDGEGMVPDDAVLAFERHATSKIETEEDLGRIRTLGFRGEALASIASVSKIELVTKVVDEPAGTRIMMEGGELKDVRQAPRPTGTTVTVRDLFFNTPARRKFMRSQATENYHITSVVTHYALANPATAFSLKSNGRELIRAVPARTIHERAYQIFGSDTVESFLPVKGGREFIVNIDGYVSAPRERRTTRDAQYFFINGRYVRDKVISAGLQEGYRSVLPHGVYPVALLFLEIPLEEIDVNVHPAKTEVRFRRAHAVREVIAETVRKALADAGVSGGVRHGSDQERRSAGDQADQDASAAAAGAGTDSTRQVEIDYRIEVDSSEFERSAVIKARDPEQEEVVRPSGETEYVYETDSGNFRELDSPAPDSPVPVFDSAESLPYEIRVEDINASRINAIGQLHESFIVAQDDSGLLLIDQHVAHERILFDKFRHREGERAAPSQNLLVPETIDLTPAQSEIFAEVRGELEEAGFQINELSGRTLAIQGVPAGLPALDIGNLLAELLDTADRSKRQGAKDALRDEIAASLACRAAVKINTRLTGEKMRWMVDRLMTTSSPTTCPHGRPVILRLTMKDIERRFHRS